MSAPEKLSWFVGCQIFLVGFILAACWLAGRVMAYKAKIPQEPLIEHRNRMKLGFIILVPLYLVTSLVDDFSHHAYSLELTRDVLIILILVNYMVRSVLTIHAEKTPDRLKQLAWLEMGFSFLATLMVCTYCIKCMKPGS
ncbi:MAG: hypothetical protein JF609_09475 [Verrucomicrobia bacterium]|nr:hypothetical protein [Verrucomicrobiota bacterium]